VIVNLILNLCMLIIKYLTTFLSNTKYVNRLKRIANEEMKLRELFYDTITEQQKAEFINGQTIMHSPVKLMHSKASDNLMTLLNLFVQKHDLGFVGHEKILISLTRNDFEPDICYFNKEKSDKFTPNQMKFPAPDFIAEILSESTEKIDRGIKMLDYALHQVQEYWIIDPENQTIEQYKLVKKKYQLEFKAKNGNIKSITMPNFEIPVQAVFDKQEFLNTMAKL